MNDKKLIRRALLGDKQAQKECTEKGIVLPCPICHGKIEQSLTGNRFMCKQCGFVFYTPISGNYRADEYINIVHRFNTRPAPPIGRCGECEHYNTNLHYCDILSQEPDYGEGHYVLMLPGDFCSYFEPRED